MRLSDGGKMTDKVCQECERYQEIHLDNGDLESCYCEYWDYAVQPNEAACEAFEGKEAKDDA